MIRDAWLSGRGAATVLALAVTVAAASAWSRPSEEAAEHARQARAQQETPYVTASSQNAAGRYLLIVGGCNDCHTPGWGENDNRPVPDSLWLTGNPVGYRGPWGTSYAANLRRVAQRVTADQWVEILKTADHGHGRPPMPWVNTALTSDRDLRAMYAYTRSLGPRGVPVPRAVPPDSAPKTPYISFMPQQPGQ